MSAITRKMLYKTIEDQINIQVNKTYRLINFGTTSSYEILITLENSSGNKSSTRLYISNGKIIKRDSTSITSGVNIELYHGTFNSKKYLLLKSTTNGTLYTHLDILEDINNELEIALKQDSGITLNQIYVLDKNSGLQYTDVGVTETLRIGYTDISESDGPKTLIDNDGISTSKDLIVNGTSTFANNTTINDTLINTSAVINSTANIITSANLTVNGTSTLASNTVITGSSINTSAVINSSSNIKTTANLTVDGTSTLASILTNTDLTVNGTSTLASNTTINANGIFSKNITASETLKNSNDSVIINTSALTVNSKSASIVVENLGINSSLSKSSLTINSVGIYGKGTYPNGASTLTGVLQINTIECDKIYNTTGGLKLEGISKATLNGSSRNVELTAIGGKQNNTAILEFKDSSNNKTLTLIKDNTVTTSNIVSNTIKTGDWEQYSDSGNLIFIYNPAT